MKYRPIGEVYKISNDVSNQVYIGKTYKGYKERFKQHIADALRMDDNNNYISLNKFHIAIRELGVEHFTVALIDKAPSGELEELERHYIAEYNSFYNGYNSTLGGDTGRRIDINDDEVIQTLDLYKQGFSMVQIAELMGLSNFTIRMILEIEDADTDKSYNSSKNKLDTPVFGVQVKCGQMVSFNNEYIAGEELINAGLTRQGKYYVKNDIRRSIAEDNYGVGGYKWFRTMEDAVNYSNSLKNKDRYNVINIQGSQFVRVKLIETIRQKNRRLIREAETVRKKKLDNYDSKYPPSKEVLAELLKTYNVSQIANHYKVSFNTLKNRLKMYGLPSIKQDIREYRQMNK